jgi:hypothetical protein
MKSRPRLPLTTKILRRRPWRSASFLLWVPTLASLAWVFFSTTHYQIGVRFLITNVIEAQNRFVTPKARTELANEAGLDLHEIAISLGADFKNVKRRYLELQELGEISGAPVRAANDSNGLEVQSFVLSVDDAKFLVTQYGNAVGRAYCRWLIAQERQYATVQENLADPEMARRFGLALIERANAQDALAKTQAVIVHMDMALTTSQSRNGGITREKNQLVQKVIDLQQEVGDSRTYKTVRAMLKLHPELSAIGIPSALGTRLSNLSKRMGVPHRDVPDSKYGTIKAHHVTVWNAFMDALKAPAAVS